MLIITKDIRASRFCSWNSRGEDDWS